MRLPVEQIITEYQKSLFAAAFSICRSTEDANDVVQDTLVEYYLSDKEFQDKEHIHAWLIRVALNKAKNIKTSFWHRNRKSLEDVEAAISFEEPEDRSLFEAVMKLPKKYRIVIHLFYYEEYSVKEVSGILDITENNTKKRLQRGRDMLRQSLEGKG